MTNTTDTYWEINGVSIQTYAYNVITWGGTLQAPPPLRGDDVTIPYRPGTVFQARRPGGRTMTFDMWVVGADEDGNVPEDHTMRAEFEKNFKMLRNLFWNQGRQVTITRKWRDYGTGTLMSADAKAVFADGFAPSMNGALRATFSVDMYLSDPFFYGDQETINFSADTTSNVSPTILGDYETTDIIIDFDGARTNPRITNTSEGIYVNVTQTLSAGQLLRVDIDNFTAKRDPLGTPVNVVGSVTSFGHPFWFALRPGTQNLSLTGASGSGTATLKYRPRWI